MDNWYSDFEPKSRGIRGNQNAVWIAENLKRCPLCGAVNAALNDECFVCRWHGEFEREPESIEQGINDLIAHSPELDQAIRESDWIPMTQAERVRAFLRKIFWPTE